MNKEQMKENFLELKIELDRLGAACAKLFSVESDLVFLYPEISDRIETERGKLHDKRNEIKETLAAIRSDLTKEELAEIRNEYIKRSRD
jgi:hypothetical protein